MTALTVVSPFADDVILLKLAREIAIDHETLPEILKRHGITSDRWESLQKSPVFLKILEAEVIAWHGAGNTHERTKLKAAALVEEWLPEANARIHDKDENLPAKVELGKLLARIAGMGLNDATIAGGGGEKFSVTINLGADHSIKIDKQLAPRTIDAEAIEGKNNGAPTPFG